MSPTKLLLQSLVIYNKTLDSDASLEAGFLAWLEDPSISNPSIQADCTPPIYGTANYIEFALKVNMFHSSGFSRNIFVLDNGYFGVGPGGSTASFEANGAVQIGDVIAIIPGNMTPFILRELDEEHYTFVGNAIIGCIDQAECFQPGNHPKLSELRKFHIR